LAVKYRQLERYSRASKSRLAVAAVRGEMVAGGAKGALCGWGEGKDAAEADYCQNS
jgi:hypothetical protein